jgi:hypothetical protein
MKAANSFLLLMAIILAFIPWVLMELPDRVLVGIMIFHLSWDSYGWPLPLSITDAGERYRQRGFLRWPQLHFGLSFSSCCYTLELCYLTATFSSLIRAQFGGS